MRIGTRTLIFGTHQIIIHALYVFLAWTIVMRRLPNFKELICIIIHDWGYWGKPNIDDEEGERHPEWAARKVGTWFGRRYHDLCLYHSRFYSKKAGRAPSILCWIDKYAVRLYPDWLWIILSWLTGELKEYMNNTKFEIHGPMDPFEFKYRYDRKVDEDWMPKYIKGWRKLREESNAR